MVNPKKKKKSGYRLKSIWECGGMLMNRVIKKGHWLGDAHEQDDEGSVLQEACWEAGQGGMRTTKTPMADAPGQGVKWKAGLWTETLRTRKKGDKRVSGRRNTKAERNSPWKAWLTREAGGWIRVRSGNWGRQGACGQAHCPVSSLSYGRQKHQLQTSKSPCSCLLEMC